MSDRTLSESKVWSVFRTCLGASMGMAASAVVSVAGAQASGSQVPWECSNYSEEAQARCLNAFIEQQREQIGKLQGQLQAQQETMNQLKGQIDRQAAVSAEVQQQLSQRPAAVVTTPSVYSYVYPPVGIGLYLGRPWIYGPPYYYHPYWGPRFYGRWGRRW